MITMINYIIIQLYLNIDSINGYKLNNKLYLINIQYLIYLNFNKIINIFK